MFDYVKCTRNLESIKMQLAKVNEIAFQVSPDNNLQKCATRIIGST